MEPRHLHGCNNGWAAVASPRQIRHEFSTSADILGQLERVDGPYICKIDPL